MRGVIVYCTRDVYIVSHSRATLVGDAPGLANSRHELKPESRDEVMSWIHRDNYCFLISASCCLILTIKTIQGYLLVKGVLDLLHESLLLVFAVSIVGTVGTSGAGLSNRVVLGGTLSTSQGSVATWTRGVLLEVGVGIVVRSLTSSGWVGSKVLVGCSELIISTC